MSHLTIYAEDNPSVKLVDTNDFTRIGRELSKVGVRFERWDIEAELSADADNETVLEAYRPHVDALIGATGAGSADVIRMRPHSPGYGAMRRKFLDEHIHTEDEVRFFVDGSGVFTLHVDGRVYAARCDANDLISVPAGVKHWFDAGDIPYFTVLRVFTDNTGWTPHYTGDAIAARFMQV